MALLHRILALLVFIGGGTTAQDAASFTISKVELHGKCNYYDNHHGIQSLKAFYRPGDIAGTPVVVEANMTSCVTAHVRLESIQQPPMESLKTIFTNAFNTLAVQDERERFQYIKITFNASAFDMDYSEAAFAVDEFIQYRPWWRVIKEPFYHNNTNHLHHRRYQANVVLQRYPKWESYLRFLASVQYPKDCRASPLVIHRMSVVHPGWFSIIDQVNPTRNTLPLAIYNHFFPHWDTAQMNRNAFIKGSDCPSGNINQWECAFIPLTNCTMPKVITDCKTQECYRGPGQRNFNFETTVLTSADTDGALVSIKGNPMEALKGHGLIQDDPDRVKTYIAPSSFYYRISVDPALHKASLLLGAPTHMIFWFILLVRRNAFYRLRIDLLINSMRDRVTMETGVHFKETTPCVAAHVRRGDRVMYLKESNEAINMTEFCYNVTNRPDTCLQADGSFKKCPPLNQVYDFGCDGTGVPFTSYSLAEIAHKADQLAGPTVRTLVVMTDDHRWLREQTILLKQTQPSWTVITLPPPTSGDIDTTTPSSEEHTNGRSLDAYGRLLWGSLPDYHYIRSEAGTDSGVYFWAQMELASKCDALVGHFGSGIAVLLYQMMCFEGFGICPPMFNWQNALEKKMNTL